MGKQKKKPKKKRKKTRRDTAETALSIVEQAIGGTLSGKPRKDDDKSKDDPPEKDTRNPAAVALSKLGASKGGKARAKKLSKKKRIEIARKAAAARWKKS